VKDLGLCLQGPRLPIKAKLFKLAHVTDLFAVVENLQALLRRHSQFNIPVPISFGSMCYFPKTTVPFFAKFVDWPVAVATYER
jgi:predicted NUDIX family NTP pyrophosphohydrolase